jgi:hypothetical protein
MRPTISAFELYISSDRTVELGVRCADEGQAVIDWKRFTKLLVQQELAIAEGVVKQIAR